MADEAAVPNALNDVGLSSALQPTAEQVTEPRLITTISMDSPCHTTRRHNEFFAQVSSCPD